MPKAHDLWPWLILIPVEINPAVLRVTGPRDFRLQSGSNKTDVIVRRGVDQVSQLLLGRP
jgi:hypothetical protein